MFGPFEGTKPFWFFPKLLASGWCDLPSTELWGSFASKVAEKLDFQLESLAAKGEEDDADDDDDDWRWTFADPLVRVHACLIWIGKYRNTFTYYKGDMPQSWVNWDSSSNSKEHPFDHAAVFVIVS